MALAKTAIVASSILCTACVAAAVALPMAGPLMKTVEEQAKLAATYIDFAGQDAFSALPFYAILNDPTSTPDDIAAAQANLAAISGIPLINQIQAGNRAGFYGLASTSALSAFDIYQNGLVDPENPDEFLIPPGSNDAFVPSDTNPGYAALSGVSSYQAYQASGNPSDLAGIDAFSAIPAYVRLQANDRTALYGLASTSATQSFDIYQNGAIDPESGEIIIPPGNTDAFVPTDSNAGYAALSGLSSIRDYLASNGDLSKLNGIDGFSSIKNTDDLPVTTPTTPPVDTTPTNNDSPITPVGDGTPALRSFRVAATQAQVVDTTPAVDQAPAPVVVPVAAPVVTPATPPVTNNKQGEVRNSANYSPVGAPVLFGSGKGKGPDSGISGWGNVANGLRGALGMGPDPSTQGGGGDAGGDAGAK